MSGWLLDGVVAFDASFYQRLARMINEEPVANRDLAIMGQLRSLGIEKGKEFSPSDETKAILENAAKEAHQGFKVASLAGEPWWPGTHWKLPESIGPKTGFKFQTDDALYIDNRGMIFYLAFAAPKKLGAATLYLACLTFIYSKRLNVLKLPRLVKKRLGRAIPSEVGEPAFIRWRFYPVGLVPSRSGWPKIQVDRTIRIFIQ